MNSEKPTSPTPNGFERLAQEARVRDHRMNRTDAPYTDDQLAQLRESLNGFRLNRRERGKPISWERLADKIALSAPTLNAWAHGKYEGDDQRVARLVDQFLADEVERANRLPIGDFANIESSKRALGTAFEGISGNAMVALLGPPGCGKSSVLRALNAVRVGAMLITIDEHSGSRAGVTRKLAEAVLAASGRTVDLPDRSYERWALVLEYFRRTRNSVLLIDEAQKLLRSGLETIRDLHDLSDESGERNLPIVLAGDERFYRLITQARSAKAASTVSAQFARRIAPVFDWTRDGVPKGGGSELYTEADLVKAIQNDRLRLVDRDGLRWLTALANTRGYGLLGFAMRVLRTAWSIAGKRGPLTVAQLLSGLETTVGRDATVEVDEAAGGELLRRTA